MRRSYPFPMLEPGGAFVLDARELVRAAARDLAAGVPAPGVAARFHNGVAAGTVRACAAAAARCGVRFVVLSGGVFQNVRLLESTATGLGRVGLRVLVPERLPPNDGGLCFGQVAVAAARLARAAEQELQPAEPPRRAGF